MSEPFMLPLQFLAQLTGIPYAGLKAYFYAAGTFNNQTVYRDAALTTPHEQPVQADDNGFLPPIYKNPNAAADYRVVLRDAFDTLIPNGDVDQIPRRPLWALPFAPLSVKTSPYNAQGNDAADDRAAIQAAIDAAGNAGGGWVLLPAGIYRLSGSLSMRANVTLLGEGHRSCLKIAPGSSFIDNVLKFENISHAAAVDLRIDGNRSLIAGGTQYGFFMGSAVNCQVIRCRAHSTSGVGIHVFNSDGCLVEACVSWDNVFHGLELEQSRNSQAIGNNLRNNLRNGIYVFEGESAALGPLGSKGITLVGNTCHNNAQYGIGVQGPHTEEITLQGNVSRDNGQYGVTIFDRVRGALLTGNAITGNGFHGLYLYRIQEAIVLGNRFRNNSTSLHAGFQEIHLDGDATQYSRHNIIVANSITIDAETKAAYAVKENTVNDGPNMILANVLTGAGANGTIAPLQESGANSSMALAKFNIGVVRQNRGSQTFSGTGAQNVFSWPHGLTPDEPRFVAVTPYSPDAKGPYSVSSDGTNISVTFAAPPLVGTGNVAFRWSAES